jgi:hypothetical protein
MTFGLIKNTNRLNKGEDINNDLKNVPCQRKRHSWSHPNNSLPIIIDNNFACKSIKKKDF